jgi:hypothetical protein
VALERRGYDRLAPVSVSYPPGDPGREDELIEEITAFWSTRPTWVSIDDVPMLANAREHAARADIPFQHAFENWLRALLGATARQGSRVVLYGDRAISCSPSTVFLRDLFSNGRWRELRREWRAFDGSGYASCGWGSSTRAGRARAARGRTTPNNALPMWLDASFVARHSSSAAGGRRRCWRWADTRRRKPVDRWESAIPRVLAEFSIALERDVELRAPLLDQRVVRFALATAP